MSRTPLAGRLLRRWHKRFGLLAAVFFTFLAVSGVALNHGDAFGLDKTKIATPWLMAWYGLKPVVPEHAFVLEGASFCWQGDIWVLAAQRVKPGHGEPLGAVGIDDLYWVATPDEILLYNREGQPVDKIERELLPAVPIRRIGVWQGHLVANAGNAAYASSDGISWEKLSTQATVAWSRPTPLAEAQQRELAPFFAPTLPLQRIVADTHSGRIFGTYGVLVTDALAFILLLLAGSGGWLYVATRGRKTRANKAHRTDGGDAQALPPELR